MDWSSLGREASEVLGWRYLEDNVVSERSVEIPWAIRNSVAPILDVGCVESTYLDDLPEPVDGLDVRNGGEGFRYKFVADIRDVDLPDRYATVLAISTLEHVGLDHAPYGTEEDDPVNGDIEAVMGCWRHVAPEGKLLISVPFGAPRNYGWFRQYDLEGLARLCGSLYFTAEIWVSEQGEKWIEVESLDHIEQVEQLEYNFEIGSARAVALITIERTNGNT